MAAQEALFGVAAAMTGQETKVHPLFGEYEHTVDNLALEVIGHSWSGEVASLPLLEDWELGRVSGIEPPHRSGLSLPRSEG